MRPRFLLLAAACATLVLVAPPPRAFGYELVADPKLPAVSNRVEDAKYRLPEDRVLRFPINVWGGWAPIIAANRGFAPSADSVFAKAHGFKLALEVVDDPSKALTMYANGETPFLWGTVDMLVLFGTELALGPHPKVFMQVDWSNGGDGIVVRSDRIRSANDLRGKTVVLAPFSPSHFFLLTVLKAAGIGAGEVKLKFARTAFDAADAFLAEKDIDAVVTWAPKIYELPEKNPKEMKLLTSTLDAKRLIADVFAVRADFAAEHRDIIAGLVAGILEGREHVRGHKDEVGGWMAQGFSKVDPGLDAKTCTAMIGDAHLTNHAENMEFFANPQNPTSFVRTFNDAAALYREAGVLKTPTLKAVDVGTADVLKSPAVAQRFKGQRVEYGTDFGKVAGADALSLTARKQKGSIVTMIVRFGAAEEKFDESSVEVAAALEEVAKLAARFGGAHVLVEGHADPVSMGLPDLDKRMGDNRQVRRVRDARARRLAVFSAQRAAFVKRALADRYALDPAQFVVAGKGGESPVTLAEKDRAQNRRVEITVIPLESE